MTKLLSFSLLIILLVTGIACTPKLNIVNAKAFVRTSVAGTIAVDENNVPRSSGVITTHLIFVQTKANKPAPEWDTAWIDQKPFAVKPIEITQPNLRLGRTKDTNEEIVLSTDAGNKLWQLMVTSDIPGHSKTASELTRKNAVVLTGTWKQKSFTYPILKEQLLEAQLFQ